jgi:hypothetical protein
MRAEFRMQAGVLALGTFIAIRGGKALSSFRVYRPPLAAHMVEIEVVFLCFVDLRFFFGPLVTQPELAIA